MSIKGRLEVHKAALDQAKRRLAEAEFSRKNIQGRVQEAEQALEALGYDLRKVDEQLLRNEDALKSAVQLVTTVLEELDAATSA